MSAHAAEQQTEEKWPTGKWIDHASVDDLAVVVAHKGLRLRLTHVERILPLAASQGQGKPAHIHHLRVGCRRATAALNAFGHLEVGKEKRLKGWLRRLRRAAGPVRDADVLRARLEKEDCPASQIPESVIQQLIQFRKKSYQSILAIDIESDRLHRAIKRHLASFSKAAKTHKMLFGPFARAAMSIAAGKFITLAEEIICNEWKDFQQPGLQSRDHKVSEHQCMSPTIPSPSIEQLHQLRIAGKRLRYSIELFYRAFPESLRLDIYPKLRQLQDRLGVLNDHDTAQHQFQKLVALMPPNDDAAELARHIIRQREETLAARTEFLKWWTSGWARDLQEGLAKTLEIG